MKALYTQELMNIHPALEGSKSVSAGLALGQRLQQCLGVLEVRCVEPFGEPTVDRRQQNRSWELRAAMSLCRLWQRQGKRTEAYELRAPIYGLSLIHI